MKKPILNLFNDIKLSRFSFFALALAMSLTFVSCDDDDDDDDNEPQEQTIAQIVTDNPDFSILLQALETANLVDVFTDANAELTVFAPNNAAFEAFIASSAAFGSAEDLLASPDLANILRYHVLGSEVPSSGLPTDAAFYTSTLSPATFNGATDETVSLLVDATSGVTLNGSINVTTADVEASNGVIHIIDNVLVPPTVVDLAIQNGGFTQLVEAVLRANLAGALATGPITVFAPTDAAFNDLYTALEVSGVSQIDVTTLANVLQYHVVGANVESSALSNGQVVSPLLQGSSFTVNIDAGGNVSIDGTGSDANVVLTDVQATNGVVHVIDTVLLPE